MIDRFIGRQKIRIRASTMLLIFSAALLAVGRLEFLFRLLFRMFPGAGEIMWRFGVNLGNYLLIGASLSLVFLLYSIYRKKTQYQFVGEIIVAGLLCRLI